MKKSLFIILILVMGTGGCASATGSLMYQDWSDFWSHPQSGTPTAILDDWVDFWSGDRF